MNRKTSKNRGCIEKTTLSYSLISFKNTTDLSIKSSIVFPLTSGSSVNSTTKNNNNKIIKVPLNSSGSRLPSNLFCLPKRPTRGANYLPTKRRSLRRDLI